MAGAEAIEAGAKARIAAAIRAANQSTTRPSLLAMSPARTLQMTRWHSGAQQAPHAIQAVVVARSRSPRDDQIVRVVQDAGRGQPTENRSRKGTPARTARTTMADAMSSRLRRKGLQSASVGEV